jgi:hypothetical protein
MDVLGLIPASVGVKVNKIVWYMIEPKLFLNPRAIQIPPGRPVGEIGA